ncbi:MAG: alanine racemase [Rhodothermales bacterium]
MFLDDLPTPCLLIEKRRLDENLRLMQEMADSQRVFLRPHVKTHKSLAIARSQLELGARGITVAKVGEAERFVEGGFEDVRIAYTVIGEEKYARISDLMDRARVSFCIDTREGAHAASAFFAAGGRRMDVLLEVNVGYNRCGVDPSEKGSIELAADIDSMPGLRLVGILTHAGHSYAGPEEGESHEEALRRISNRERDAMLEFAARLGKAGVADSNSFEVSIGSTPSMRYFENTETGGFRITEIRPGNYVFNDGIQLALRVAELHSCALTVLTTVVSRHRDHAGKERLFLDAGKKILTSDTGYKTDGYGILLYNARTMQPMPHAHITNLSEEHGWVDVLGGSTLSVGDRVRVVPNHACVAVNTQDLMYVVDGEDVVDSLPVDARGRVI